MDCGISEGYHCEGALVGAGGLESVPPVSDNVDWNGYMLTVFSTESWKPSKSILEDLCASFPWAVSLSLASRDCNSSYQVLGSVLRTLASVFYDTRFSAAALSPAH